MKKLIALFLTIGSLTAVAQKSLQNVAQVNNIYHVRGEIQVDSLARFKWLVKTDVYKNNIAEDSLLSTDVNGIIKQIAKASIGGGGGGISQAYADAHYMPKVTANTAYNTNFGTIGGSTAQGNDSRILDGETAFTWGNHASVGYYKSSNFVAGVNYLAPNGSAAALTSFPTLNQNTTGTAANVTGIVGLNNGGTGLNVANLQALLDGILPSQTGNTGKVLQTNGTTASWQAPAGGGGTGVTGVSVASSNGFSGAATAGSTPVITISTPLIGLLKGNGTAMLVATAGTDYSAGTAALATGLLKSTTGTGVLSRALPGTDYLSILTGDATTSGNAITFNTINGNVGEFNTLTVNGKGQVTSARNVTFLTGNQTITLHSTGADVGIASTSGTTDLNAVLTINPNVVGLTKLQQVAQNHIFYRASAGTGNFEDHTLTELKAALSLDQVNNTTDANKGVSIPQQAALDLKANLNAPALVNPTATTQTLGDATNKVATDLFVQNALAASFSSTIAFNNQSSSYTLVLDDTSKFVLLSVAIANTVTIPNASSVAFPIGAQIPVSNTGAGQTTFVAASGVTINSPGNALKLRVQSSSATLIKTGTNTWLIIGDVVP